jgi:hypothetical protein
MTSLNPYTDIKKNIGELRQRYNVSRMGLFGSFARGEADETSDIDVLVEFSKPVDIFEFLSLKEYLELILGRKVDLVTEKALKPQLKQKILREVKYV